MLSAISMISFLPPHAPRRLQRSSVMASYSDLSFASTRSAQIATLQGIRKRRVVKILPPHAPRRLQRYRSASTHALIDFASTRSAQIATQTPLGALKPTEFCLHTLRADCNGIHRAGRQERPFCLHTLRADCNLIPVRITGGGRIFASTRSAQIATLVAREEYKKQEFCLHTLRADCNYNTLANGYYVLVLPPHAPRRLQL